MGKKNFREDLKKSTVLEMLHAGHRMDYFVKRTGASVHTLRLYFRNELKIDFINMFDTDAFAEVCYAFGFNGAEYLRARYANRKKTERAVYEPVKHIRLNGTELVFQPGVVRSSVYFMSEAFMSRNLPRGFSAKLFQRVCVGHTTTNLRKFHGNKVDIDWLIRNNSLSLPTVHRLATGVYPPKW